MLDALQQDQGKAPFEGYATELGIVYDEITMMLKHLNKWARPKRVASPPVHFHSTSKVYPSPLGVVLVLSPWNYPLQLALVPMVDAIAAGKEGAVSLHRFVQPTTSLTIGRNRRQFIELDKKNVLLDINSFDNTPRQRPGYNEELRRTMQDGRACFTEEQVKTETARCLGCGASVVDPNKCIGCGICTTRCGFDAIRLHRERPECSTMVRSEDKMKAILPYMLKRAVKIKLKGKKG